MTKAIKPVIGKREDMKEYVEIKSIETIVDTTEYKSPNIMGSIDIVMNILDEYSNRTHRKRNATTYVMDRIPKNKNWSRDYIHNLRSLGNRLKEEGAYNQAQQEDWDFVHITNFLKDRKKSKNIKVDTSYKIKTDIVTETSEPSELTELEKYLKKTRPGIM